MTVAPPEGIVISFILVVIVAEYWRVGAGAGEEVEMGEMGELEVEVEVVRRERGEEADEIEERSLEAAEHKSEDL